KFWLHVSRKEQASRLKHLSKDPLTAWQVTDEDHAQQGNYERFVEAVEEMLVRTDAASAPWVIVEATDRRFARLKIMETTIARLEAALTKAGHASDADDEDAQANGPDIRGEELDA